MKQKYQKWLLAHRALPLAGMMVSQALFFAWKGWDSYLWFPVFLFWMFSASWLLSHLVEPKPAPPPGAIFTCPDCKTVLYPEALVRPVRGPDGTLICPNCYATVSP